MLTELDQQPIHIFAGFAVYAPQPVLTIVYDVFTRAEMDAILLMAPTVPHDVINLMTVSGSGD